jgi:hypothetical protein
MRKLMVAVVSMMLFSLLAPQARADVSAQDKALLTQAQQTGHKFFLAIGAKNSNAVSSYLLSQGEAKAYFASLTTQQGYQTYVTSMWNEIRELIAGADRIHKQGAGVQLLGVEIVKWAYQPQGGNILRATSFVVARPVFNVGGKRVVGADVIHLVHINNYWKVSAMRD